MRLMPYYKSLSHDCLKLAVEPPNATTSVEVVVIIRDLNGEGTIDSVIAEFFDALSVNFGDPDDNNDDLLFEVSFVENGFFAFSSSLDTSRTRFLRSQITNSDGGIVGFVHD